MSKEDFIRQLLEMRATLDTLLVQVAELEVAKDTAASAGAGAEQYPAGDRDGYMTAREVQKYLGVSKTRFYAMLKEGVLPSGYTVGVRCRRWRRSDLRLKGYGKE